MPRLLERIRTYRQKRRAARTPEKRYKRAKRVNWFILFLVIAGLIGGYFWVTSARLLKEPIHVAYGPEEPPFINAMGPLVGAEFFDGNKVEMLVNGDQFFPAMLQAISQAQKTITLESYIWSSGFISNKFIDALSERARAGVKVHIIVDGMGTLKLHRSDRQRLRDAGVEIYGYGREHWWQIKPNINHRTHRKLLVIDGKIGFTGGMCIDDRWLGNATHDKVWRETQVRLEGPIVRQMQATFSVNWLQTTSGALLGEDYFPKLNNEGRAMAQCYRSGPNEGPQAARLGYLFAIAAARKSIDIGHAYFVPDQLAVDMLVEARARGVRVRVIVPEINDSAFGRAAARSRWGELLEAGVEMHLYQPAMFHAKTMVVDGVLTTIGSANFDNRSFSLNDEVTVNILDRAVAEKNLKIFEDDLQKSRPYTRAEHEGRPGYTKALDWFCGLFRSQF
jgi:cardiolipin synthase A/B